MSSTVLFETVTLVATRCVTCGTHFAIPDFMMKDRRETGRDFYCPNGHTLSFHETETQKLRKRLEGAEARERHARDQAEAAERSNVALRGVVTRTKKRVGNGVCPCCQRTFANLRRHMQNQHPDYAEEATP